MVKKLLFILAILCSCLTGNTWADTSITTAYVSGHWTLAGSPYKIYNDITVNYNASLTIDPGVEVVFQGPYAINVAGSLYSTGTAAQPISYHIQDTTGWSDTGATGGWHGIWLSSGSGPEGTTNSISFQYCNVTDMKNGALTIYSCNLAISNCNFTHNNDAPLWLFFDTVGNHPLEVANCNFYNNICSVGPIIGCTFSSLNMHDCSIYNNNTTAFSTFMIGSSNFSISNNEIYQNTQTDTLLAATVKVDGSQGVFLSNKFHHNTSMCDAVLSCSLSNVDINRNLFCNNAALIGFRNNVACGSVQGGGAIRLSSEDDTNTHYIYTVRNNVIANNYSGYAGGAIYVFWANANIFNNQIINNSCGWYGGGIYVYNWPSYEGPTFVKIKNNIFYNNNYSDLATGNIGNQDLIMPIGDTIEFDHNWISQPLYQDNLGITNGANAATYSALIGDTTTNIVGTTPGLVNPTTTNDYTEDATASDFSLLPTSPCINAGDTTGAMANSLDYAGNLRVWGGNIDIGAFEWNSIPPPPTDAINEMPATTQLQVYPNPAINIFFIATPQANGTIQIHDISGRTIEEKNVTGPLTSFDVHSAARGIYFAVWDNGSTQKVQKIILQ